MGESALQLGDEVDDVTLHLFGLLRQFRRRVKDFARAGPGIGRTLSHNVHIAGHVARTVRRLFDVAGYFAGRRPLFLDRRSDGRRDMVDFCDGSGNRPDGGHRVLGRLLDAADMLRDVFRCLGGLGGQRFNLGGDDGKTFSGFARARRLDRGVKREKVGLFGDGLDQIDDLADFARRFVEHGDDMVGFVRLIDGVARNVGGARDLAGDFADRRA